MLAKIVDIAQYRTFSGSMSSHLYTDREFDTLNLTQRILE